LGVGGQILVDLRKSWENQYSLKMLQKFQH